jgi:hypothetical protein
MPIQKKSNKKRKVARCSSGQVECRVSLPSGWIDVNEKLPENDQYVIVRQNPETTATRHSLFAKFDATGKRFISPGSSIDGIHLCVAYWSDITHWMPMPPI